MINSERRTFEEYCLVKDSYKNQKDKGRANAYAQYLKNDIKKDSFYYINDKKTPNSITDYYFNNIKGKKILCSIQDDVADEIEVVNGKQKKYYEYLATAEVIITRDLLSVYYVCKEGQYLGIEVDNYLNDDSIDYEKRIGHLKGLMKADFFITDKKEEFKKRVVEDFGEFGNITSNIFTRDEFLDLYQNNRDGIKKKESNKKKTILFINDFTDNEKWDPVIQSFVKNIELDKYEVIIIGDNKNPNSVERIMANMDKRVRALYTKGWMVVEEDSRLNYDYIMSDLLYFSNLDSILKEARREFVSYEWKRTIGVCDIERITCFNITNWKWLFFINNFKNMRKEIFVGFEQLRKLDNKFYDFAKYNYHNYINSFDTLYFYTKYDKKKYEEEYGSSDNYKVGFTTKVDIKYWSSEITNEGQKYIVYNDFYNGNRYIDVVLKPIEDKENVFITIDDSLLDEDYKKISNYAENNKNVDIYVFDYTETYEGDFSELNVRTGNIKYYKRALYFYLMKKYLKRCDEIVLNNNPI